MIVQGEPETTERQDTLEFDGGDDGLGVKQSSVWTIIQTLNLGTEEKRARRT